MNAEKRVAEMLLLLRQRLAGEVVQAEGESGVGEDADEIMVEGIGGAEVGEGEGLAAALFDGLDDVDDDAEKTDDATGGDEAGSVERAGGDFAFGGVDFAALFEGVLNQPAHEAAGEDGERGGDGEVGSDGEGEGADAEQLNNDDESDAEED